MVDLSVITTDLAVSLKELESASLAGQTSVVRLLYFSDLQVSKPTLSRSVALQSEPRPRSVWMRTVGSKNLFTDAAHVGPTIPVIRRR